MQLKIGIIVLGLVSAVCIYWLYSMRPPKADCSYVLPAGYHLLYNHNTQTYVVADRVPNPYAFAYIDPYGHVVIDSAYQYLTQEGYYSNLSFDLSKAYRFHDSCVAKETIKERLRAYFVKDSTQQAQMRLHIVQDSLKNDFKSIP